MEVATPLVVRSHSTATITHNQQQSHRQFIQQQHRSLNENNSSSIVANNSNTPANNLHHHHNQSHQRLDHPELAEQENIDHLSGSVVTPVRVIKSTTNRTTKTNTNTCGGGLSLSSARRAHLVSRGAEFIAHQTSSTTTNNTSNTKFGLNNNTTSTGNSYNSTGTTNINSSYQQTPLSSATTNTGKRLLGSPNLQKTK